MASIQIHDRESVTQFSHICGGSIVNEKVILTAPHCGLLIREGIVRVMRVTVGCLRWDGKTSDGNDDENCQTFIIRKRNVVIDRRYEEDDDFSRDTGLIFLDEPIHISSAANIIKLRRPPNIGIAMVAG